MESATRAWIITKDHLSASDPLFVSEVGITGPRNAPAHMIEALKNGKGHHFRMFDDDGELYYEGRAMWADDDQEEGSYGPLGDFGMPNAGAVSIKYTGHPEFDCA